MEIVVAGRHTDVPEKFRRHAEEKLAKLSSQFAPRAQRIDVEVTHERNPRQADSAERVELTVIDKGPVIRAEASADDRYGALDMAIAKLTERLRRSRDRRKDHRNHPTPLASVDVRPPQPEDEQPTSTPPAPGEAVETMLGDSPVVIREKVHTAQPMTVDDALYEMEMVGHDFFLFIDAETAQPSVAYRRRGWSYGVIKLDTPVSTNGASASARTAVG